MLGNFINAIRQSTKCKNWLAALFLSLTLPDICGAMENPNCRNGKRYKLWYEKYLSKKYKDFTAEDCWLLRNACLHQGSDSNARMIFQRVHFIKPTDGMNIHNNIMNNVLQLQIDEFCNDICEGVEQWVEDVRNNQDVINRISQLMKIHPISSLQPFINIP